MAAEGRFGRSSFGGGRRFAGGPVKGDILAAVIHFFNDLGETTRDYSFSALMRENLIGGEYNIKTFLAF